MTYGVMHQSRHIMYAQALHDLRPKGFDRLYAEVELRADKPALRNKGSALTTGALVPLRS